MNMLRPDWYSNRNTATPKADIAEYVRLETSIPVPTVFGTLEDGMRFVGGGGSIILRSESPDQYEGPSGIFQSYVITPDSHVANVAYWDENGNGAGLSDKEIAFATTRDGTIEIDGSRFMPHLGILATAAEVGQDVTYHRLLTEQRWSSTPNMYRRLASLRIGEYMAENTFSAFEYIDGLNVTVVADSAKPERWHVYGSRTTTSASWLRVNGNEIDNRGGRADQLNDEMAQKIVRAYEMIRQLPRFNAEHCPIMEMQLSDDGTVYFLQYHRARDFMEAQTELDPKDFAPSDGWIKADDARGDLPLQTLDLTLHYPIEFDHHRKLKSYLKTEKASANMNNYSIAEEIVGRNRLLRVAPYGAAALHGDCADGHMSRSGWFKAQSGLILPRGKLKEAIGVPVYEELLDVVYRSFRTMASIAIEAASDGDSGYIRVNHDRGDDGLVITDFDV